jgi:hypothetical protein
MTRFTLLTLGLLAGVVSAQEPAKPPQPVPPTVISEAKAEEAKPQEKSAQDVINPLAELQRSIERKRIELAATKKLGAEGGLATAIKPFFTNRTLASRSVAVEIKPQPETVTTPAEPTAGSARLMTADEKASLGESVVMIVDGQSVTKAEVDELVKYYGQNPGDQSDDDVKRQALRAVIVQKAALAAYASQAAGTRAKLATVEAELANGGDFAELAKKHSMCPSAAQGGDLDFFGRGMMDPIFEKAAFSQKMGETSPIIQTSFGYHIVKTTGFKKGENPSADQVRASHILVMFDADSNAARNVARNAMSGRSNLAFRDEEWQKLNPFAR